MNLPKFAAALLGFAVSATQANAQTSVTAKGDTVVLIVKSPRGQEVAFSGTVVLRDANKTLRYDNEKTPFELRLAKQDIDARFAADDGGGLNGEIVSFKDGERQGQAWGTTYRGALSLYFAPGFGFGFGSRNRIPRAIP